MLLRQLTAFVVKKSCIPSLFFHQLFCFMRRTKKEKEGNAVKIALLLKFWKNYFFTYMYTYCIKYIVNKKYIVNTADVYIVM